MRILLNGKIVIHPLTGGKASRLVNVWEHRFDGTSLRPVIARDSAETIPHHKTTSAPRQSPNYGTVLPSGDCHVGDRAGTYRKICSASSQ